MSIPTEIITIGDELLIGQTIDTNSAWLGQELHARGYPVNQITSISDKPEAITSALDLALKRADLLILTGGLGPTLDDLTKKTLAEYFDMPLVQNDEVLDHIESLLGNRNVPLNQLNKNQALLPKDCLILKNDSGTAPGMLFRRESKIIVSLPGVPYEMKSIVNQELFPWLKSNTQTESGFFRMVMTTGYPESVLAAKLSDWESRLPEHCSLAYLPSPGMVKLRISAEGKDSLRMKKDVDLLVERIIPILGDSIYSIENVSLEKRLGELLVQAKKTIGTIESCTGGTMAKMITSVPGSSQYFKGSIVCYANEAKIRLGGVDESLIVDNGAVSKEVVSQLAKNALDILQVDYSIASSGIAGPEGGSKEKPVGLVWLAVATRGEVIAKSFQFGNHRGRNITRSSMAGLNMLRLMIENEFQ